ncbi:uncharacterized protein ACMZJ9_004994 [Mantella aurantiaca]
MALSYFWTWAILFLSMVVKVNSNAPVPVLILQEKILEGEDTAVTCTLPCLNCLDVNLTIMANVIFKSCTTKTGNNPNVTCIVEVTPEVQDKEFTCDAQYKTKSLPKKMAIQKTTPSSSRDVRKKPVLATILAMLMTTSFFYYLR